MKNDATNSKNRRIQVTCYCPALINEFDYPHRILNQDRYNFIANSRLYYNLTNKLFDFVLVDRHLESKAKFRSFIRSN